MRIFDYTSSGDAAYRASRRDEVARSPSCPRELESRVPEIVSQDEESTLLGARHCGCMCKNLPGQHRYNCALHQGDATCACTAGFCDLRFALHTIGSVATTTEVTYYHPNLGVPNTYYIWRR